MGQIVRVKVLSADPKAKRIALSIKALETPPPQTPREQPKRKPILKPEAAKPSIEDQLAKLSGRFKTR